MSYLCRNVRKLAQTEDVEMRKRFVASPMKWFPSFMSSASPLMVSAALSVWTDGQWDTLPWSICAMLVMVTDAEAAVETGARIGNTACSALESLLGERVEDIAASQERATAEILAFADWSASISAYCGNLSLATILRKIPRTKPGDVNGLANEILYGCRRSFLSFSAAT